MALEIRPPAALSKLTGPGAGRDATLGGNAPPAIPGIFGAKLPFFTWQSRVGGSLPEFIVWDYLTLKRNLTPEIDFSFQQPGPGGPTDYALDFYFPMRHEAWQIEGFRYSFASGADAIGRHVTKASGIRIITLWEDDLFSQNGEKVMDLAWFNGQESTVRRVAF